MSRTTIVTLIILVVILLLVGWYAWYTVTNRQSVQTEVPAAMQAFTTTATSSTYTDSYGNRADLDQHIGTVIVAHSWATWVPSSKSTLRDLQTLQAQYKDSEVEVSVLAINRAEPQKTVNQYLTQLQVKGIKIVNDSADSYFDTIDGSAMPETIFYDVSGNIVHHESGSISLGELQAYTELALKESKPRQE